MLNPYLHCCCRIDLSDCLSETFNQFKARSSCWLAFAEVCMMILRIIVANEQTRCSPESSEAQAGLKDKMGCCSRVVVRLRDILRITRRHPSGGIGFMTFLTAKLVVKVTFNKFVVCMNSVLSSSL